MLSQTLSILAPEIVLVAVAVFLYMGGAFAEARNVWRWAALGAIVGAAAALWFAPREAAAGLPLELDALAGYARWLILGVGTLLVLLAWRPLSGAGTPEYLGSLLLIVAGLMLVAVAGDLVLLFVGLELVSIPTYIILYIGRREVLSQEATAKYFYLSILASALLLYGLSFLYGAAGSTDLHAIHERLLEAAFTPNGFGPFTKIAMVLIFAGLGFRVAAVPFHFYAPDVFQGTSTANAGLLSVVPKIAGLVALVRLVAVALPAVQTYAWPIAVLLAVLTMTVGNLVALWQDNIRRLLAYSSIANAGYMLIGLAVYLASGGPNSGFWDGVGALLFYLLVYAVATLGTFAALAALGRGEQQIEGIEELAGLAWSEGRVRQVLAWTLAVFLFSLAGIPPLAGFFGKLAIFASALSVGHLPPDVGFWLVALAVVGVLNSAVAAYYYLRIISVMFFRMPLGTPKTKENAGGLLVATLLCAVLTVYLGLHPGPWLRNANQASPSTLVAGPQMLPDPGPNKSFANRALFEYPERE